MLRRSVIISMRSTPRAPPLELSLSLVVLFPQLLAVRDGTAEVLTLEPALGGETTARLHGIDEAAGRGA